MKNPDHFYLIKAPRDLCAGQGPNRWLGSRVVFNFSNGNFCLGILNHKNSVKRREPFYFISPRFIGLSVQDKKDDCCCKIQN